ncbi:hypothetical protein AgCh_023576 [Apium graveolens]
MVDAIVSFAIEKLGEFIAQEVNILLEVKDNLRWLKDELRYLQSSIRSAESRLEEEQIRNWVEDVIDVANDTIKILSDFSAHQQEYAAPKQGILDRVRACVCIIKEEVMLYDIGKEIDSLKRRIEVIKNRRNEYRIDNILATPNKQQQERTLLRTTAINIQVEVVGFEDDFETLKAELDSEDPSLKVISIHGMGGLGKTSLATKLYNSSELRQFDTLVKVCVSNEYNIKDVLKRIIKSFKGPEHEQYMSAMDEHDLLQYLPKLLQDRGCYLALIDDIWDIKAWNQMKIAFPNQKNCSRIIITTRNKKVEEMADDKCFVHQLRFLTEHESWELFCKRAEPTTPDMEELGKAMVSQCRGLPLAIVVLSGLLLHNMNYNYWSEVKEHIWRHLKDGESFQIEEIVSLSFNDLSPQMKDCFLYLARYPEDDVIDPVELKRLWIAEEFITEAGEGEGVIMENIAENCLNELINRNLLQVNDLGWNGQIKSCRVHDLVRDLAIKKAKEHKLLVVLESGKHHPELIHLLEGQPRHVIYNEIGEYLKLVERRFDALRVRSLAVVNYLSEDTRRNRRFSSVKILGLNGSYRNSSKLQTLHGRRNTYYTVPREICELHELRHLAINVTGSLNIEDPMPTLGSLSNLTALQLTDVYQAYKGNKMDSSFIAVIMRLITVMNAAESALGNASGALEDVKEVLTLAPNYPASAFSYHSPSSLASRSLKPASSFPKLLGVDNPGFTASPVNRVASAASVIN